MATPRASLFSQLLYKSIITIVECDTLETSLVHGLNYCYSCYILAAVLSNELLMLHVRNTVSCFVCNISGAHVIMTITKKYCRSIPLQEDVNWEQEIERISKQIDGFSGREIAKLAVAWQVGIIMKSLECSTFTQAHS